MMDIFMLRLNLSQTLKLSDLAVDWLVGLFSVIQVFDDLEDVGTADKKARDDALWWLLVGSPSNPFYQRNLSVLTPVIATAILKWHGANTEESTGNAGHIPFVWRAAYYDVVLMCVALEHGHTVASENAHIVSRLYGEDFETYMGEFNA